MRHLCSLVIVAWGVSACSAGVDKATAEGGVVQFRSMLAAQRYHDIYAGAAQEFRQSATEPSAVRFLQAIHDRLGAVRASQEQGWQVNFTTGGTLVSLKYTTQFTSGSGTENFVYRMNGTAAQLMGYHINSLDLMAPAAAPLAPAPAASAPAKPGQIPGN